MAADVEDQVVAGDAHQVRRHVAAVVLGRVLTQVRVDGRKTHGHRARAVHGRLVHERDLHVLARPAARLEGGAARGHAAADDQNVGGKFDDLGIAEASLRLMRALNG